MAPNLNNQMTKEKALEIERDNLIRLDNFLEKKFCSCGVPYHLHNTCCGWENANIEIVPAETVFNDNPTKARWEWFKEALNRLTNNQ